ncbi:hypothetical protein JQM64_00370 [Fournierella massiliensis]|nr:SMI1/KNR4 family protein [Fournierella massiliensis]MCF2556005.1 hypothetical protein [Fournierella massiliensis]
MMHEEFFKLLENTSVNDETVASVESAYKLTLPDTLKKVLSVSTEDVFVDEKRLLSLSEILSADIEYGTAFIAQKLIPVFDSMDNDFIVFDLQENTWTMFNIVDLCQFAKRELLADYFN